ncbi:nucleotidyltransferase domain-containing protein [Streptomyces virginiae]|uniref:nucleotidyltransferase domain-containing protein n=1 Tax=Streptomyces virginiae TaxID=1961 RepID=UPI0037B21D69
MTGLLTDEEIDSIVGRIVQVARPQRVVMFGSYAKGRATVKSDLDLLVVMPTEAPVLIRASEVEPYLGGCAVPVDLHFVTVEELEEYGREEHHFLHSVLRSGKTLYERDR